MPNDFDREVEFDEGLEGVIFSVLKNIHTAMPAQVVSFDADRQTCSVQPALMRKKKDAEAQPLPVLEDVPIVYPGSGGFWLTFPLVEGAFVLLVFSERALDAWLQGGGVADPAKKRMFSLSDAFAIPGVNPFPDKLTAIGEGLTLRNRDNTSYVQIKDSGQVDINGNLTVDP
jgi:hypothetical protein